MGMSHTEVRAEAILQEMAAEMASIQQDMRHRFSDAKSIKKFMLGGKATITIVSKKTGVRFTYLVKKAPDNRPDFPSNVWFVALLRGPDNENDFSYMGTLYLGRDGVTTYRHGGQKSKVQTNAPSNIGFAWVWSHVECNLLPDDVEVWHEGKCGRCNRKLTVPNSIASGFGPECINYIK